MSKDRCQKTLTLDPANYELMLPLSYDSYVTLYCDRAEGHKKQHQDKALGISWNKNWPHRVYFGMEKND